MARIKANADYPQEVIDLVNSITIEGADIPLEGGVGDINGVSLWAIGLSLSFDDEWEVPESGTEIPETPETLAGWCNSENKAGIRGRIAVIDQLVALGQAVQTWSDDKSDDNVDSRQAAEDALEELHWADTDFDWDSDHMADVWGLGTDDGWDASTAWPNEALQDHEDFSDTVSDFWNIGGGPIANGYHDWDDENAGDLYYDDGRASRIPSSLQIKCPYMGDGVTRRGGDKDRGDGFTFGELKAQYSADLQFLELRIQKVKSQLMAYAIVMEGDDSEEIQEAMERIAELQEQDYESLSEAEQEELSTLLGTVAPAGLTQRADQQQRLQEMQENGEVGEYAAAMRAQEQCFLMADIVNMSKLNIAAKKEYRIDGGSAAHMVHGEIGQLVSTLMFDPAYTAYYFLTPDKLSYLTPSIRLYQVLHEYYKPNSGNPPEKEDLAKPVDFEIPFYQHITQHSIEQMMSGELSSEGRGGHVGLKSFDWTYQGSNPASSRRDIKATLELEVQNFSELVRKRTVKLDDEDGSSFDHEWMYADLAIRRNRDHRMAPDCLYSQLKVVVGWGMRESGSEMETLGFTTEEIRAIRNSQMTMFLTIIDHSFDIRDDGSVSFKIEYRAYIEGAFTSPEANVLVTPELLESQQGREQAKAELQAELADPAGTCRPEDMAELRRRFTAAIATEKEQAHMSLLHALEGEDPEQSRLYVRTVDIVEMMTFMQNPFAGVTTGAADTPDPPPPPGETDNSQPTTADSGTAAALEEAVNFVTPSSANSEEASSVQEMMESVYAEPVEGKLQITYFFLGDLIHVALNNIDLADGAGGGNKKFDKTRLLLGPLEINSFQDPDVKYQINLADVPISVNYFLEFFLQRIQSKQEVLWYIMDFIKDIIKNLIYKTLNDDDCFQGAIRQQANFQNLYLVGSAQDGEDDPIQQMIDGASSGMTSTWKRLFVNEISDDTDIPILSVDKSDEEIPSVKQYNYILLYAADPQPSNLEGNFEQDIAKGVYHFHIGTNKGLVKRIKFQKTDQPYLREARYMSQGYDSLSQLREPYKIDVEMYGNARIFPGMTVYINPAGLGYSLGQPSNNEDLAWTLGLGGYHMVINAQHTIARGAFDTRVNCVWVLRGSAGGETTQADGSDTPARNTQNCEPLNNYGTPAGYNPNAGTETTE